ncbi:hypothetical protein WA158_001105 [Blastocystis sp. Blastoise]
MIKEILIFGLLVLYAYGCNEGESTVTVSIWYSRYAQEQSVTIWKGKDTSVQHIFREQGITSYQSVEKRYDICISSGLYTIRLGDSFGDGWGFTNDPSWVQLIYNNRVFLEDSIPFVANTFFKEKLNTFVFPFALQESVSWKYSDISQSSTSWTDKTYADSLWSEATVGTFPAFTATTRYYRLNHVFTSMQNAAGFYLSIKTGSGIAVYIEGNEVYRYKLPKGSLTGSTTAIAPNNSDTPLLTITIPKFIMNSNGATTICIEVHHYTNSLPASDVFSVIATQIYALQGECSGQQLSNGQYEAIPEGTTPSNYGVRLFDMNLESYYQSSSSNMPTIIYSLPKHNAIWLNSYMIASSPFSDNGDPTSWNLEGKNEYDSEWEIIDIVSSTTFISRKEEQVYHVSMNMKVYNSFKVTITGSNKNNQVGISSFEIYSCNIAAGPISLSYSNTTYYGKGSVDSFNLLPISRGFTDFTSVPEFPYEIELDPISGRILGQFPNEGTFNYTIHAVGSSDNQEYTTQLTFIITGCNSPDNIILQMDKINKQYGDEESWTISNSNDVILYTSPSMDKNSYFSKSLCIPSGLIKLEVKDSRNDGWDNGSKLTISIGNTGIPFSNIGDFTNLKEASKLFYINTFFLIPINSPDWKYVQGVVPSNWFSTTEPSGFNIYPSTPVTTTSPLWLFRKTVTITSLDNMCGFELSIFARAGVIIYINEEEIHRTGLPDGDLSTTMAPLSGELFPIFFDINGPLEVFHTNQNTIAIGIINIARNNPTTLDFNAKLRLLYEGNCRKNLQNMMLFSIPASSFVDKLFDNSAFTSYTYPADSIKKTLAIMIRFKNHRAEFINKYCLTSSTNIPGKDPSDWSVLTSNDNKQFISIGNVTNAYFSDRKSERCFYLPQNHKVWNIYKFVFTETADPTILPVEYSLSEVSLHMIDLSKQNIPPPLSYTISSIQGFIGIPFSDIIPNSNLYGQFSISPPLTLPLELDTSTGSIRGIPTDPLSSTEYTITAISPQGSTSSTKITLSIGPCVSPNIMFVIHIKSGTGGDEISYKLLDSTSNVLDSKNGFIDNHDNIISYCKPIGSYSLTIQDSGHNGWNSGYVEVLLEDQTLLLKGGLGDQESSETYNFFVGSIIPPLHHPWTYINENKEINSSWNQLSFDDSKWNKAPSGSFGISKGITQYFRSNFSLDSLTEYTTLIFNIKCKDSLIVYINGHEVYRYGISSQHVTFTTLGTVHNNSPVSYGSSILLNTNDIIVGNNIIAIEIHKSTETQEEINFDCTLSLTSNNSYRVINGIGSSTIENDSNIAKLFDNIKGTLYTSSLSCDKNILKWTYNGEIREFISHYEFITGSNCNVRHPKTWTIEGSNDNINWATLHKVVKQPILTYSTTIKKDFFNNKAYHAYRMIVEECSDPINQYSERLCTDGDIKFQLAELGLYTKRITGACQPDEANGWGGALEGDYAYKNCPTYYEGRIQALCTNGVLGDISNTCTVMKPQKITYPNKILLIIKNRDFSTTPVVHAAEYTCSAEDNLPQGIVLDRETGTLFGKSPNVFNSLTITVTCSNKRGSASTELFISCEEEPPLPIWVWIISALAAILIIIIILCIFNRMKSRYSKGYNTGKKNTKINAKQSNTNKAVKI